MHNFFKAGCLFFNKNNIFSNKNNKKASPGTGFFKKVSFGGVFLELFLGGFRKKNIFFCQKITSSKEEYFFPKWQSFSNYIGEFTNFKFLEVSSAHNS